jgi:RecA/RadA recombinase
MRMKEIIKNVVFGLIQNQDNLSRHSKLFNICYDNRNYFGELTSLLEELFKFKTQKRTKLDNDDIAKVNGFWILPTVNILNQSVRKMVFNWIEQKWGNADTEIMLSLLNDYPESIDMSISLENKGRSDKALQKLLDNSGDNDVLRLIKTGYNDLDNTFGGGLELGNIVMLAGATGSGKTSVAVNMCLNMAEQLPTAYLMSEQDETSIDRKFFGVLGRYRAKTVDTQDKIERSCLAKQKYDMMIRAGELFIYNTRNRAKFTIEELVIVINQLSEKGKKIFFIDNLSYIEPVYKGKRYTNFPDFVKMIVIPELNSLCSKTDSLLVLLAQVNNEVAKNKNMSITLNQIMGGQDSVQAAYGVITIVYPYWFVNQQTQKEIPSEFMRYSLLKALKVRELSESSKIQYIYSEGDYFRAATDEEKIRYSQLRGQIND